MQILWASVHILTYALNNFCRNKDLHALYKTYTPIQKQNIFSKTNSHLLKYAKVFMPTYVRQVLGKLSHIFLIVVRLSAWLFSKWFWLWFDCLISFWFRFNETLVTQAGVFLSTLSYHHFCVSNWVCKRPKAFSHAEDMKELAGGLQSTVSPPVGPGQSPGEGPRSEAPGSSVYLGFENLLL